MTPPGPPGQRHITRSHSILPLQIKIIGLYIMAVHHTRRAYKIPYPSMSRLPINISWYFTIVHRIKSRFRKHYPTSCCISPLQSNISWYFTPVDCTATTFNMHFTATHCNSAVLIVISWNFTNWLQLDHMSYSFHHIWRHLTCANHHLNRVPPLLTAVRSHFKWVWPHLTAFDHWQPSFHGISPTLTAPTSQFRCISASDVNI